jgi:hypothetical protein
VRCWRWRGARQPNAWASDNRSALWPIEVRSASCGPSGGSQWPTLLISVTGDAWLCSVLSMALDAESGPRGVIGIFDALSEGDLPGRVAETQWRQPGETALLDSRK